MDIVDGTQPRPLDVSKQGQWDQSNNDALTSMYLSMSDDEVEAVSGCRTANDIWTKLNSIHQSEKYYSVMASEDKPPVKTMIEIQNYASQLRAMGVVIDDDQEVARVISSLMCDKYRQFREAWRSVEVARQNSALLLSRLKTWELEDGEYEKVQQTQADETQKAYAANKKPRKTKEEIAQLKKTTKCHICKQKGHWRSECPKKHEKKEESSNKVEKAGGAYAAGSSSDLWINDSGANRHNCGRLEWCFEYQKYQKPKPVGIADNSQMLVEGCGKAKVKALIRGQWKEI